VIVRERGRSTERGLLWRHLRRGDRTGVLRRRRPSPLEGGELGGHTRGRFGGRLEGCELSRCIRELGMLRANELRRTLHRRRR
jgi:hypothetical protein